MFPQERLAKSRHCTRVDHVGLNVWFDRLDIPPRPAAAGVTDGEVPEDAFTAPSDALHSDGRHGGARGLHHAVVGAGTVGYRPQLFERDVWRADLVTSVLRVFKRKGFDSGNLRARMIGKGHLTLFRKRNLGFALTCMDDSGDYVSLIVLSVFSVYGTCDRTVLESWKCSPVNICEFAVHNINL